jgi:hypothetical protein
VVEMSKAGMPLPQVSNEPAEVKQPEPKEMKVSGVQVVAMREGFFDQKRIKEGDVFMIGNMNQLGSWMKITDAKLEAERRKKEKEAKAKSGK